MSGDIGVGKLIEGQQHRDAIHVAVAPVVAASSLRPGQHIAIRDGKSDLIGKPIGIVDPFFVGVVEAGDQFWLFLYPGSITSLRHDWTHPAFESAGVAVALPDAQKMVSEAWMRAWAVEHTPGNYYDDDETVDPERALAFAIEAGREMHIGPYENAREFIDDEWWGHWETITGEKSGHKRGSYFSCAC